MPPELVLLVGLPGAGKSTFYHQQFAATHDHVSLDLMSPSARNRRERQQRLVAEALTARRSVVVDNTNPALADRAPLIALGRACGARVTGYFFDERPADCLVRNANRTGRALVPPVAIYTAAKRLVAPAWAEGFDALFRVKIVGGQFDVVEEPRPAAP